MNTSELDLKARPTFDTLSADPRRYRSDVRLMRMAIRRGWLDDAPPADRAALVARFENASAGARCRKPAGLCHPSGE